MSKKSTSFILQAIYSAVCLFEVLVCLTYSTAYDTKLGDILSLIATFPILPIALVVVLMPVSLILNIRKTVSDYRERSPRRTSRLIWTIASPILYFAFFTLAIVVFVGTTGGV